MGEIQDKEQRSMHLENVKKGQLETLLLLNDPENSSVTNYRAFAAADLWKSWRLLPSSSDRDQFCQVYTK